MNNLIVLNDSSVEVESELKKNIFFIEREIKRLENLQNNYKKELIKEIEGRGLDKCTISNELFTLIYKAPTTRESLDSKKLKKDMPEIYNEYIKISNVSSSITTKLKEDK